VAQAQTMGGGRRGRGRPGGRRDLHGEQTERALAHRGGLGVVGEHFGEYGRRVGGCGEVEDAVDGVGVEGPEALTFDGDGDVVDRGHGFTVRLDERHHWR